MKTIEIKENEAALVLDNEGGVTVICSALKSTKIKISWICHQQQLYY